MWLIVGLGNPDEKHEGNRHNVGFMAIEHIADTHDFEPFKKKFLGAVAKGKIGSETVLLLTPHTYMNNSGNSITQAAKFFKIPPEKIIVLYDELDLDPGKLRVKKGGGAAGHNGIRSAIAQLGTPDFWRVRIGIGHPGDKSRVSNYVLSDFSKAEQKWLEPLLESLANEIPLMLEGKESDFMTRVAEAL